jgi:predicted glycosyltransferase involved in capsule biosynthesis
MISFIIHLRKDSEERIKNINTVLPYFESIAPGCEFVIVEDDSEPFFQYLATDNILYFFNKNENVYNKCKSYNLGLTKCTKDIVCFLDIDCIISKENLEKSIEMASSNDGIYIGYNGTCVYFDYPVKNSITDNVNLYDFLDSFVNKNNVRTMVKTENYTITNTKAVGGCLIGKKEVFTRVNGFNPNFIGWGYEDNEIISRARILKVPVYYVNTFKPLLFHLPHEVNQLRDKSAHSFYDHNHREVSKVEAMCMEELEQYIKTW